MTECIRVVLVAGQRVDDSAENAVQVLARLAVMGEVDALVAAPRGRITTTATALGLDVVELPADSANGTAATVVKTIADGADLVHAVGASAAAAAGAGRLATWSVPFVVTADCTLLPRPGRRPLSVSRRGRLPDADQWLVHGRSAAARLVASGGAEGGSVNVLSLLPVTTLRAQSWRDSRAEARRRLGATPGVTVVVGSGACDGPAFERAKVALAQLDRRDIRGLWIDAGPAREVVRRHRGKLLVVDVDEACDLLPGADVVVGAGTPCATSTPALDATWAGLPVVATVDDVAAELVLDGAAGRLATPRELPRAIAVECSARPRPTMGSDDGRSPLLAASTRTTARAYVAAVRRPLSRSNVLLRRAGA